jgi:chaperonin GroES
VLTCCLVCAYHHFQAVEVAMSAVAKAKAKIKIQPLEDRVVIMPADESESMRGGLYIPDTAKEKPTQGEVIAVGPGRFEKGERIKMDLSVGDTVIYGKYSGTPFTVEGDEVIIIKASDVLAKLG